MASSKMREHLAPYQIKWEANSISAENLTDIAQTLMGFSREELNDIFTECFSDDDIFKSAVLQKWAERNADLHPVQIKICFSHRVSLRTYVQ